MRLRFAVAALALLSLPAEAARRKPVEERIQVVEVELEVEVLDREGRPVPDLGASDFRVLDEGRERPIVRFEGGSASREEVGRDERPAATVADARPGRHFLFLFDLSYSSPLHLQRARLAARELVLRALPPEDFVAVAALSVEQGARWLAGFSRDRAQTVRAIDGLSLDRLGARSALDPLRLLVVPPSSVQATVASVPAQDTLREEIAQIGGEVAEIEAEMAAREARRFEGQRVELWSRGLGELAERLAVLPARKQVVLFSEGFDARLLLGREETAHAEAQVDVDRGAAGQFWRIDNEERFGSSPVLQAVSALVTALRRADCVVHALDPGGLRAFGEAQRFGRSRGSDALFYLSRETGGSLLAETNEMTDAFARILERTAVRYRLAFRADDVRADGAYRRLRVEVPGRRGLRVVHRPGWFAPRPFPELHPFERELLAADGIVRGAGAETLKLAVAAPAFFAGEAAAYVPLLLEVEDPSPGSSRAREFELFAYVLDENGGFRGFLSRRLRIPVASGSSGNWKFYGSFELGSGRYHLRVLVRSLLDGRTGLATVALAVPALDRSALWLAGPFVHDRSGRFLLIRDRESELPGGATVYPFVVGGEPFVPAVRPRVRPGARLEATALLRGALAAGAVMRWSWEQGGNRQVVLEQEAPERGVATRDQTVTAALEVPHLQTGMARLLFELVSPEGAGPLLEGNAEILVVP